MRLLVVEDDEAHVELLRRAYEDAGRPVRFDVVPSFEGARLALERDQHDAVVADFVLPDGCGLDLLPFAAARGCPVVLMTSQGDERIAVEALRGGAFDYVVKTPRALATMPLTVERALREHALLVAHRRAEDASRRSEERLRATLASLGEVVVGLDDGGSIRDLHVPVELAEVFPDASADGPLETLVPEPIASALRSAIARAGADIVEHPFEHRGHAFRARICPRSDGGCTIALRDETARRRAERARERLELELRHVQRLQTLGTLAGGVAHDFNNLLLPVMLALDLALNEVPPDSEVRGSLDGALVAATRARELVRRLLTFSRSAEVHERRAVSLATVVREGLTVVRASLGETRRLNVMLDEQAAEVLADASQIQQVVLNLVMNAHQALGDDASAIDVTVAASAPPSTARRHLDDGPWVKLVVRDRGEGIPPDVLDRIFEPFFTTKAPGHGTGLGLTVVHGIVQAHGGVLKVQSSGEGTSFEVFLPCIEL
jgi:signal transduction histidine kinase/FixJ family two-component response regulator